MTKLYWRLYAVLLFVVYILYVSFENWYHVLLLFSQLVWAPQIVTDIYYGYKKSLR